MFGVQFQDFISDVFEAVCGDDFSRIRARGRAGDGGCDGFIRSSGTVLQCYGADATADRRGSYVATKISSDFAKAVSSFGPAMKRWNFVHNMFEGLPYEGELALVQLRGANSVVEITATTREGIQRMLFSIEDESRIQDLLGQAPEDSTYTGIDVSALQGLLNAVATLRAPVDTGEMIGRVPREKLSYNNLSAFSAAALDRRFEREVSAFVTQGVDPSIGDKVSTALNQKYNTLREQLKSPDDILSYLLDFVLGESRLTTPTIGEDVAAHAILAYFFFRCDIFEDVPIG